jgi:hypothetical protein
MSLKASRFARVGVVLLPLLAFTACNSGATAPPRSPDDEEPAPAASRSDPAYRADIELICNVDAAIGAEQLDPIEAEQKREDFLVERVKQPDAIYFLTLFRTKPEQERGEMLGERARELELASCPLRDRLKAAP